MRFVVWSHIKKSPQRYKRACVFRGGGRSVGVCWRLSITNEDKISLHTAVSRLEPAALGQGPSVSLSASCSKVASSSPKPEGWPLPQVMGDICLIYHRGTSALAASVQV